MKPYLYAFLSLAAVTAGTLALFLFTDVALLTFGYLFFVGMLVSALYLGFLSNHKFYQLSKREGATFSERHPQKMGGLLLLGALFAAGLFVLSIQYFGPMSIVGAAFTLLTLACLAAFHAYKAVQTSAPHQGFCTNLARMLGISTQTQQQTLISRKGVVSGSEVESQRNGPG